MRILAPILDAEVRKVAPNIAGVSIGRPDDKRTWRIDFTDAATQAERAAARGVLDAFDPAAPSAGEVKGECRRRILARYPEWKQANMTARGVELQDIWRRKGVWTTEDQVEADQLQAAWDWIKATRAASDVLERDRPADFTADKWWPV